MTNPLRHLAAGAPAPTYLLRGALDADTDAVRLDPRLRVVDSPRHATVLLVAGRLPDPLLTPAALTHDALPHPRASVWWGDGDPPAPWLRDAVRVPADGDPAAAVCDAHAQAVLGRRPSERAVGSVVGRAEWDDVGPYGHGGSGMTGGTPYGRPLPDRDDDPRDGLTLDVLRVTVGPFFSALPPGLSIDVHLYGDVVGACELHDDPFATSGLSFVPPHAEPFERARTERVAVTDLEQARISHHLRGLARTLRLHGLHALSDRALRVAVTPTSSRAVEGLLRFIAASGASRAGAGTGVLTEEVASQGLGATGRASGVAEDARDHDPAYARLGFEPVTQRRGDVRARTQQRIDEVRQSLRLCRAAGDAVREPGPPVVDPRLPIGAVREPVAEIRQSLRLCQAAGDAVREPGPPVEDPRLPVHALREAVAEMLAGLEWGDAIVALDSFDFAVGTPHAARATAGVP